MTAAVQSVVVIGGPTASGKSGLALDIARRKNGVVINADSMQVYDGLPLLTAQPSPEDKAAAPHSLYGVLPPQDICTAARWRDMALAEIEKSLAQGKLPVIAGGTGFYIKTLLHGISPIPEIPGGIREKLIARQKEMGNPAFHAAFAGIDPVMAARLDPFNTQRVIRAWEVLEGTGKSLAEWQAVPPVPPPAHLKFITAALLPPREKLYKNCDDRFMTMLQKGALEEARRFRESAIPGSPLENALGYDSLCRHLDGGMTLEQAARQSAQDTRNYAKRQTTWFRNQMKADIVLAEPEADLVVQRLD